jgi:hypothetical protein
MLDHPKQHRPGKRSRRSLKGMAPSQPWQNQDEDHRKPREDNKKRANGRYQHSVFEFTSKVKEETNAK